MTRLNSGIRNRHNFFVWAIFLFENFGTDSVNYADSGDIKLLVWFPGSSILKFSIIFWKCVGCAQMRGCNILKIAQCVDLITPVIFIRKIRGTYLILPKPTQFQPTLFPFFVRFFIQNHIFPPPHWYPKMQKWNFLAHLLIRVKSLSHPVPMPKRPRSSQGQGSS